MEKVVIHRPGGHGRLDLESHPDPVPGPGEVLVRTAACGINYADCLVRWGVYSSAKKYVGWPITPGFEFSGIEKSTGASVFGLTRFGGYATHVVVPRNQVFDRPPQLTEEQAAGFPVVFLTAYHALFQHFRLNPGANVLVHSAAGGMGSALLQLGKIAGARLVGVVGGPHKIETALSNGAACVIDRSREDLWKRAEGEAPEGYDVILDASGPATLRESFKHLKPTGKLVTYGAHGFFPRRGGHLNYASMVWNFLRLPRFNPLEMIETNRSVIAFNVSYLFKRADLLAQAMGDLLKWLAEGKIKPLPVTAFPLRDVARAHAALESGKTVGKLVLTTQ